MFTGLKMKPESRQYKSARIELQRQAAPLFSLAIPVVMLILTVVLSSSEKGNEISYEVQIEEQETEEIREIEKEEIETTESLVTTDDIVPDLSLDVPIEQLEPAPPVEQQTAAPIRSPLKTHAVRAVTFKSLAGINDYGSSKGKGLGTSGRRVTGDLIGVLYDFKRDKDGNPRTPNYWDDLQLFVDERFKASKLPYYQVRKQVSLSHILCPVQSAEVGPETFGALGKMEPRQWIAHYSGTITAPTPGKYRFVGSFDDVICVWIDGKPVLDVRFGGHMGMTTGLKGQECKYKGGGNTVLCWGPWVELSSLQPHRIDIVVGEYPGGAIGGELYVQQKGVEYENDGDGRPILPFFCTARLSDDELLAIKNFPAKSATENIPIFAHDKEQERLSLVAKKKMLETDIEVVTDL